MENVGERIKAARLNKGWTQGQLADAIDVSSMAISRYENGSRTPNDIIVEKIAKQLDVSFFELYFGMTEEEIHEDMAAAKEAHDKRLEEYYLPGLTKDLVSAFSQLNEAGQLKAIERVEELTEIKKYRNK